MVRKSFFALAAVLVVAASSNAAIIGVATKVKDPGAGNNFGAPDAGLPAGWVAYQLSVQSTAGEPIGAIDFSTSGGKLHQRWTDTDFDGTTNPSPNGPASDGRGDSHLTAPAGSPFGSGPSETNSTTGSPLVSTPGTTEYGLGDLSGAWAILAPSTTANIAYLVFKESDGPQIILSAKAADPTGLIFPTLTNASFGGPFVESTIPEPATVTMIGLAIFGAFGLRRRG
ncbi:MAG: PEP-CTERM sorting domain-containing protein [Pirellulales bacterium]